MNKEFNLNKGSSGGSHLDKESGVSIEPGVLAGQTIRV